jgi:Skp family chaperone for outer membrane proteins
MRPALGSSLVVAAVLALGLGVGAASVAVARSAAVAPPSTPVIATIDLEEALKQLKEKTDKEATLKANLEDAQGRLNRLTQELKDEEEKVKTLSSGADRDKALKNFREKAIRAEFERQYQQRLLSELQAEMLRDLYNKISDASTRLARQNGYSLVLASDEKIQIPASSDPADVSRAISLRRMIYADGALDVTKDLVTLMNNEYAAGKK